MPLNYANATVDLALKSGTLQYITTQGRGVLAVCGSPQL